MPFKSKAEEREYKEAYQRDLRAGVRRREPGALHEALVELRELRELRALVQKQRKRIWFLEHKDAHNLKQRQRRRAGFEQDVMATLAKVTKKKLTNNP
jgi:hypothetical protein